MKPITIGRYLGGKAAIAAKILPYLQQECSIYGEPMAGLYSIGLNIHHAQHRYAAEANPRTHNLLTQIRENPKKLIAAINGSTRKRAELEQCWEPADNPIEDARRYYWVCQSTFRGGGTRWSSGVSDYRVGECQSHQADHLWAASDRLQGVDLVLGDGLRYAIAADRPDALHYIDPPYEGGSRQGKDKRHKDGATRNQYAHEADHRAVIRTALRLRGAVVISGYENPYYAEALAEWQAVDIRAYDAARKPRTERLWLNPAAWERLPQRQMELLSCS